MINSCVLDFSTVWSAQHVGYGFNPYTFNELDSLLSLLDAATIFDKITVPYIPNHSYGMHDFLSPLFKEGIVERTTIPKTQTDYLHEYVARLSSSTEHMEKFFQKVIEITNLPWYDQALDLFGGHGVFRYFGDVNESTLLLSSDVKAHDFAKAAEKVITEKVIRNTANRRFWRSEEFNQVASFLK